METEVLEKVQTTPKLRFSGFTKPWSVEPLEKVATFHDEKRVPIKEEDRAKRRGQYPYYGSSGIIDYVDGFVLDGEYVLLAEDGWNIMLRSGPLAFVVSGKFWVNNHAHVIQALGSNQFLAESLERINYELYNTGTRQPKLNASVCRQIKIPIPTIPEQQKIAAFLGAVDRKIQQLKRKQELLEQYKKGVVQQLFSQELRFKDAKGKNYPDWEERELSEVLTEHKLNSTGKEEVYSVSVHKSLINQVEHLGRVYAAESTDHYNRVLPGDMVYTKSPTGEFKYGIIKQSRLDKAVIVSPLYGVFTPETRALGYWLDAYFESILNTYNYLHPIVQKGAKNTIAVTNRTFLSNTLKLPVSREEQEKIAGFLMALDAKVAGVAQAVAAAQKWKKGLLQQMFV